MKITNWEPMSRLDHFFDENLFPYFSHTNKIGFDLAVDVYKKGDTVIAKMSLPGVEIDEIDVSIEDNILTISGTREEESEIDQNNYYSKEIRRGSFSRSVSLPKSVDADKAEATYKKGELTITIPTIAEMDNKSVKVEIIP
jgi:HSP20 family protein